MSQLNRSLKNCREKMLNFPGPSSNGILHYVDVYFNKKSIDTVIVPDGVMTYLMETATSK